MAAWAISDVREIAPEFTESAVDDSIVSNWIARAAKRVNPDVWGDDAVEAGAYLTAHMMAMAGLGPFAGQGHTGQVTQSTVGQVSLSFASVQQSAALTSDPSLALTRYGLMYAALHTAQCFGAAVL